MSKDVVCTIVRRRRPLTHDDLERGMGEVKSIPTCCLDVFLFSPLISVSQEMGWEASWIMTTVLSYFYVP